VENIELNYQDWGEIDYGEALNKQEEIFNSKIQKKLNGDKDIEVKISLYVSTHTYIRLAYMAKIAICLLAMIS
jgi:hypothetical protein